MIRNARAWNFICRLFATPHQHLLNSLDRADRELLPELQALRAVRTHVATGACTRCPHCHRPGVPWRRASGADGLINECDCPSCGPVPLSDEHAHRVAIDPRWLTAQLRLALSVGIGEPCDELCEGVWQLGMCNGMLAVLLCDVQLMMQNFAVFMRLRLRSRGRLCLLMPARSCSFAAGVLDEEVTVMSLEDRFSLYGERLMLNGNAQAQLSQLVHEADEKRAVFGPFSRDFRWVHLPSWGVQPIALRPAQAAVFRALWKFKGVPHTAAHVMREAGLSSEKPVDVFKVRRERRGDPAHEGPLQAYRELVMTQQWLGTYAMPCAAMVQ